MTGKQIWIVFGVVLAAVVIVSLSLPTGNAPAVRANGFPTPGGSASYVGMARTNLQGRVETVAYFLPNRTSPNQWAFDLQLSTHTGSLELFNPENDVELRIDGKPVQIRATWVPASESSHHRSGRLMVTGLSNLDASKKAKEITLRLYRVGDNRIRTMKWAL